MTLCNSRTLPGQWMALAVTAGARGHVLPGGRLVNIVVRIDAAHGTSPTPRPTPALGWPVIAFALTLLGCSGGRPDYRTPQTPASADICAVERDTVLARHAVGPRWIEWTSACLPDARIVYVDQETWNLWVMDEKGGNRQCLTCPGDNGLGVDFPLDRDGRSPEIHWKGAPEPLPDRPIILFSAENEHSSHTALRDAPSIGWNNDLWGLNLCSGRYTRLTRLGEDEGLQHAAMSEDGEWFVYPLRYETGAALRNFGKARMVFAQMKFDADGRPRFEERFSAAPLGEVYYEPNDIHSDGSGRRSLYYVAGDGTMLDPYRYDWCDDAACEPSNTRLQATPDLHEEFTMIAPSGEQMAWMRGPQSGLGYHADLFVSTLDFREVRRVTSYNDCGRWPERCLAWGGQLSALSWSPDGSTLYFGLWEHGRLLPFDDVHIHALHFSGPCGR